MSCAQATYWSFNFKLVNSGLHESDGNALATPVPITVVNDGVGIVLAT